MNSSNNNNKINLPECIIINNIIPFTYKLKDKNLLLDIRSFQTDFDLVDNIYCCEPIRDSNYGNMLFFNDLTKFIKSVDNSSMLNAMMVSKHIYKPFFTRNILLKNKSITQIAIWQKQFYENKINVKSKNRLIWGLMTPSERTHFFNVFVLKD